MNAQPLILCLDSDGRRSSTLEFHRVASRITRKLEGKLEFFATGLDLHQAIMRHGVVPHVVIVGHGSTAWVGMPGRRGMHRYLRAGDLVVPAAVVSRVLRQAMCKRISLATCMSGASPRWYREKIWGKYIAPWGKAAYSDGGELSIASKLAKYSGCVVRAHTTSGHASHNPAIREFVPGKIGRSLKPSAMSIRRWNSLTRGDRAEDLLIFR